MYVNYQEWNRGTVPAALLNLPQSGTKHSFWFPQKTFTSYLLFKITQENKQPIPEAVPAVAPPNPPPPPTPHLHT